MAMEIEEPTVELNDMETGEQVVKELDKAILTKGAWQTMMFLCQEKNAKTGEFGEPKVTCAVTRRLAVRLRHVVNSISVARPRPRPLLKI